MTDYTLETAEQRFSRFERRLIEVMSRTGTNSTDITNLTERVDQLSELCTALVEEMAKLIEHTYNGEHNDDH